jgi:hypothetical protein
VVRRGRTFFTVEFEYEFEYDNDVVWFATSIPYTYSMLLKYIKSIEDNVITPVKEEEEKDNAKGSNLGNFINLKPTTTHKI